MQDISHYFRKNTHNILIIKMLILTRMSHFFMYCFLSDIFWLYLHQISLIPKLQFKSASIRRMNHNPSAELTARIHYQSRHNEKLHLAFCFSYLNPNKLQHRYTNLAIFLISTTQPPVNTTMYCGYFIRCIYNRLLLNIL